MRERATHGLPRSLYLSIMSIPRIAMPIGCCCVHSTPTTWHSFRRACKCALDLAILHANSRRMAKRAHSMSCAFTSLSHFLSPLTARKTQSRLIHHRREKTRHKATKTTQTPQTAMIYPSDEYFNEWQPMGCCSFNGDSESYEKISSRDLD